MRLVSQKGQGASCSNMAMQLRPLLSADRVARCTAKQAAVHGLQQAAAVLGQVAGLANTGQRGQGHPIDVALRSARLLARRPEQCGAHGMVRRHQASAAADPQVTTAQQHTALRSSSFGALSTGRRMDWWLGSQLAGRWGGWQEGVIWTNW